MEPGEKGELQWEDEKKTTDNWKKLYGTEKTKKSSSKFIKIILSHFSKTIWHKASVFIKYVNPSEI